MKGKIPRNETFVESQEQDTLHGVESLVLIRLLIKELNICLVFNPGRTSLSNIMTQIDQNLTILGCLFTSLLD